MYRQRSILSFLGRPSTEKEGSGGLSSVANDHHDLPRTKQGLQRSSSIAEIPVKELFPDIRGTDTPPEKLPRPVFSVVAQATADDDRRGARPFASIMQKFTREDRSRNSVKWSQSSETCHHQSDEIGQSLKNSSREVLLHSPQMSNVSMVNKNCTEIDPENLNLETSIIGPKTPAMRSLAPHLKRLQEEPCNVNDNGLSPLHFSKRLKSVEDVSIGKGSHAETLDCEGNKSESTSTSLEHLSDACYKDNSPPLDSQKKVKSIPSLGIGKRTHEEASEVVCSKFEWLNPSSIRDANGRRPNDPLFDKRTLYIPPDALKKMSASQKQYWSVKCKYMDVILFFKVGKFYELYEVDAEIGHRELDWKMTISGVGKCRQVGISEAGIDDAVEKLIARGYKVGRMEQLETADQAKARGTTSVIERKLVRVSTPSTMTHGSIGPDAVHLLAIKERKGLTESGSTVCGFAFLDYAALKVWVGSISNDDSYAALGALMMQVSPREIVHENRGLSKETQKALVKYASAGSTKMQLTPTSPTVDFPDASEVRKSIHSKNFFRGSWTSAFHNIMEQDLVLCALGGLIDHLCRMMLDDALKNGELFPYHVYRSCLRLDGQTLVNLEIFGNNVDGGPSGTLYKYLDHCMTTSGKRLLKRWICHPLKEIEEINDRLNIVEELIKHSGVNSVISDHLRRIPDLERLLGCVKASIGSSTAFMLPSIGEKLLKQRIKTLGSLLRGLRVGIDLLICLQKEDSGISALSKVVPLPTLSGLDEWLKQFEAAMEDDFPHYQDHNVKDADAETLVVLVELFAGKVAEWSQIIHALNCIDVLQSFAACAILSSGSMNRPIFLPANGHGIISNRDNGPVLHIKGLWHPYAVGENGNSLVPNDINLGQDSGVFQPSTLLLTGPNMGGKSTLLRATCLAAILAQLGCYVPCEMCLLTPADLIFTRLGAADRIMSGESTFFVECSETACVLQNATRDSIVLLDELGRGTSTFDGYSIAYAVFRHLVEKVGCRLLFATHYHPLTEEFASHPRVTLQHMACALKPKNGSFKDGEKDLIFLYRLASGACPESYGLQVALMSGIPKQVVNAASEASQRMKAKISENFRSSERRSNFSTLHEEWIRTILAVSRTSISCWDEDASDTLLCLWHELKSCHESRRNIVT